eukprot:365124-Chlamydomonas_euryale.AAC.24
MQRSQPGHLASPHPSPHPPITSVGFLRICNDIEAATHRRTAQSMPEYGSGLGASLTGTFPTHVAAMAMPDALPSGILSGPMPIPNASC